MVTPLVSVLTVTHDRRELLRRKLESLRGQTLAADMFEWVVCVNGDSDGSREFLAAQDTPFSLTVLYHEENRPIAEARNRCAEEARAALLLMSDDDCLLPPGCLAAHLAAHEAHPPPGAVVIGPLRLPEKLRLGRRREPFEQGFDLGGRGLWINATGANSSLPAAAFRRVAGYDETFRAYGGEDPDLALRLRSLGLVFRVAPQAFAYHAARQLGREGERKAYLAGMAHWRVYRRHPSVEVGLLLGVHPLLLPLKRLAFTTLFRCLFPAERVAYEHSYLAGVLSARRLESSRPAEETPLPDITPTPDL